jgi:hypothetical protein
LYRNNNALDLICVEMIHTDNPFNRFTAKKCRNGELWVQPLSFRVIRYSLAIQLQTQTVASIEVCGRVFRYRLANAEISKQKLLSFSSLSRYDLVLWIHGATYLVRR